MAQSGDPTASEPLPLAVPADEALRVAKRAVEHAGEAVFLIEPGGAVCHGNEMARRWTGLDGKGLAQKRIDEILVDPSPDSETTLWERLGEAATDAGAFDLRLGNGRVVPVDIRIGSLGASPPSLRLLFAAEFRGRRALKAEQRKLIAVVERCQGMVALATLEGLVTYLNPAGRALLGITSDDGALGRYLVDLVFRDGQRAEWDRAQFEVMRRGEAEGMASLRNAVSGRAVAVDYRAVLLRSSEVGEPNRLAWIATDMNARRVAQAEQTRMREQSGHTEKMEAIGRLAGGVAHGFNNLLTGIRGYAELVLESLPQGDALAGDVREIRGAAERAARLTEQLLAFGRRQLIAPRLCDLDSLVRRVVEMLQSILGEDVKIRAITADTPRVHVDPHQFEQALVSLAVNARDAMPQGGTLTFETGVTSLDGGFCESHDDIVPGEYVVVAVSDTGEGMDNETLAQIFEPFFTTKGSRHGTGLGLSTVWGIVHQNHGTVTVCSEVDVGTTIRLLLPAAEGGAGTVPETVTETVTESDNLPIERPGFTETILLVEDEEIVRRLAARVLRASGYRMLTAGDAEEALAQSDQWPGRIHLLVTDLIMPGMDGRALSERLAQTRPDMFVLFISGYTPDVIAYRGLLELGSDFLAKPFTGPALASVVRALLDRASAK